MKKKKFWPNFSTMNIQFWTKQTRNFQRCAIWKQINWKNCAQFVRWALKIFWYRKLGQTSWEALIAGFGLNCLNFGWDYLKFGRDCINFGPDCLNFGQNFLNWLPFCFQVFLAFGGWLVVGSGCNGKVWKLVVGVTWGRRSNSMLEWENILRVLNLFALPSKAARIGNVNRGIDRYKSASNAPVLKWDL